MDHAGGARPPRRRGPTEYDNDIRELSMKVLALIAGIFFLLLGIAGFVPAFAMNGMLFGVFPIHTTHSLVFIVAGAAGIMIALSRRKAIAPPRAPGNDMRDFV
jgi:uncharacterized membrane protein YuzA (DUF378 family)